MRFIKLTLLLSLLILSTSCAASKRKPVAIGDIPLARKVSSAEEQAGRKLLQEFQKKWKLDYNHPRLDNLQNVVDRLTKSIKADSEPWHIYLFKDDKFKNAAATKGNHLFIWTGMLNSTKSDDELATIIGHEIAHILANHIDGDPNQKLTKILIGLGSAALGMTVAGSAGAALGQVTSRATASLGEGFLVNPYSREKESEADHIGLFMMADAKYNPQAAIDFWQRAEKDPSFSTSIAFFSTHPVAKERLERLKSLLPRAMERYRGVRKTSSLKAEKWKVIKGKTYLYTEPSSRSTALGEFPYGAKLNSISQENGWIRIRIPEPGYVEIKNLEPRK